MINFIHCGLRRLVRLNCALLMLCCLCAHAAVDTSTNLVPVRELQKKWDLVPLPEVQKAAEAGDVHAMHYLGYCYGQGLRVAPDANQSLAWYQRGMQAGYSMSANNIAVLFERGLFGSNGMAQAAYHYKYAADRGVALAQVNLGILYRDGNGVPQDFTTALHWFRLAAAQQYPGAMIQLYICYWDGRGVPVDHDQAVEWLTKAGNAGDPHAQYLLGDYYETGRWEGTGSDHRFTAQNWAQAFHWYRLSADQNWAGGQYQLGMLYVLGKGVERDEARGLELVRAAADQGLEAAMHDLARLYAQGIGTPRDDADRPINLLRRSKSWEELMRRYELGFGTDRDIFSAAECYCEITQLGFQAYWQYTLSDKVEFHPGKRQNGGHPSLADDEHISIVVPLPYVDGSDDLRHALSLYLKSAKDDGSAALQIGNRYRKGQDAPQSNARAWAWFTIAAQNGSAEARTSLKALESHITPEDLKAGEQEHVRQVKQLSRFAAAMGN